MTYDLSLPIDPAMRARTSYRRLQLDHDAHISPRWSNFVFLRPDRHARLGTTANHCREERMSSPLENLLRLGHLWLAALFTYGLCQ